MAAAAAAPPPPPPPGPPPQRPPDDKLFCPRQDSVEDMPIYVYDIAESERASVYNRMLFFMKSRQRKLAPFTVGPYEVPVTPIENPKTRMSSHYIIRLINGQNPTYNVDCMIRDTDLYFVAFRRCLVLSPNEALLEEKRMQDMASSSKKKKNKTPQGRVPGWGTWYRFRGMDMEVPAFLDVQDSGIPCMYGPKEQITPGGFTAAEDMLLTMATFQDNPVPSHDIMRACNRFSTMVCEPSRLRSMYREMMMRVSRGMDPHILSDLLWENITNWNQLGSEVLSGHLIGCLDSNYQLPEWCVRHHNLKTMDDLVGHHGEIMLIKHDLALMRGITEDEIKKLVQKALHRNNGPGDRQDPGI